MPAADCPSCGTQVTLSNNIRIGQHIMCGKCREVLEIIWLEPVELDWPFEADEDDDEDFLDD